MKKCNIIGCFSECHAKGYCKKHYKRKLIYGQADYPIQKPGRRSAVDIEKKIILCCVHGCDKKAHTKHMCGMHYQRFKRHGNVNSCHENKFGNRRKNEFKLETLGYDKNIPAEEKLSYDELQYIRQEFGENNTLQGA